MAACNSCLGGKNLESHSGHVRLSGQEPLEKKPSDRNDSRSLSTRLASWVPARLPLACVLPACLLPAACSLARLPSETTASNPSPTKPHLILGLGTLRRCDDRLQRRLLQRQERASQSFATRRQVDIHSVTHSFAQQVNSSQQVVAAFR